MNLISFNTSASLIYFNKTNFNLNVMRTYLKRLTYSTFELGKVYLDGKTLHEKPSSDVMHK
jgi:hypothetical protein